MLRQNNLKGNITHIGQEHESTNESWRTRITSFTGVSCAFSFPFELDFVHSRGKVLDFFSDEDFTSSLESLCLQDVEDWLDKRTTSSAVGSLAIGRVIVSSVRALLEGVFSRISSACRSR